jgi:hypothetical protein
VAGWRGRERERVEGRREGAVGERATVGRAVRKRGTWERRGRWERVVTRAVWRRGTTGLRLERHYYKIY